MYQMSNHQHKSRIYLFSSIAPLQEILFDMMPTIKMGIGESKMKYQLKFSSFMLLRSDIEVDEETHIVIHKCETKRKKIILIRQRLISLFVFDVHSRKLINLR